MICYECKEVINDLLHEFPRSFILQTGKEYTKHEKGTFLCGVSCLLKYLADMHI